MGQLKAAARHTPVSFDSEPYLLGRQGLRVDAEGLFCLLQDQDRPDTL